MSDNWIVQNLENALKTWNDKLSEIWQLITQSPEQFKGGTIWNVIVDIHGAVQAIGLDEYIFPNKKTNKSSVRRRLETLLDNLDDKELSVIEATVNGLCKAKEPEE